MRSTFCLLVSICCFTFVLGFPSKRDESTNSQVLIIGAGMSGLSAANTFINAGVTNVTVFETRDRVGGRIWTDYSYGFPIERGAQWIEGYRNNPLYPIAKSLNMTTVKTDWDNEYTYDLDGSLLSKKQIDEMESDWRKIERQVGKLQDSTKYDAALQDCINQAYENTKNDLKVLTNETWRNFRTALGPEADYGGATTIMSCWWYNDDDDELGADLLLPDGYYPLVEYFAENVTDIRYGHTVNSINYQQSRVTVQTTEGVAPVTHQADYVVVTVPIGVLQAKSIKFTPPLSSSFDQAMSVRPMGLLEKYIFIYESIFWPAEKCCFNNIDTIWGRYVEWLNANIYLNRPVLVVFGYAGFGETAEAYSDKKVISDCTTLMKKWWGDDKVPDQPLNFTRTRWFEDPHAFGSYAVNGIGIHPKKDFATLQGPLEGNTVYFAGEHTNKDKFQTVPGAYLSGIDTANTILKKIKR